MGMLLGKISVEVPAHEVLKKAAAYEVRRYPGCVVVETPTEGAGLGSDGNDPFGRLARYIGVFGTPANHGGVGIAMTAPVITEPKQIAMTAPVVTEGRVMSFILPASLATLAEAPKPTDPQVSLREGWATQGLVDDKEKQLRGALKEDGIQVKGEAVLARYNPPWTLGPMRTNEVMLPVDV